MELIVNRVYGLLGYDPPPDMPPFRIETRTQRQPAHYTIDSSCPMCKNKNYQLSTTKYNHLFGMLPFTCAHNAPVLMLTMALVHVLDVNTIPVPDNIQHVTSRTVLSSTGSLFSRHKIEGYLVKLDQGLDAYRLAHSNLIDAISRHNINFNHYPEFTENSMFDTLEAVARKVGKAEQLLETELNNFDHNSDFDSAFEAEGVRR